VLAFSACASTGTSLQYYVLTTEAYIERSAASEHSSTFLDPVRATPVITASSMNHYVAAIGHILELDDQRASSIVTLGGIEDSHPAPGRTFLMIFASVNGRWLVDGLYSHVWLAESPDMPVWTAELFSPNT